MVQPAPAMHSIEPSSDQVATPSHAWKGWDGFSHAPRDFVSRQKIPAQSILHQLSPPIFTSDTADLNAYLPPPFHALFARQTHRNPGFSGNRTRRRSVPPCRGDCSVPRARCSPPGRGESGRFRPGNDRVREPSLRKHPYAALKTLRFASLLLPIGLACSGRLLR